MTWVSRWARFQKDRRWRKLSHRLHDLPADCPGRIRWEGWTLDYADGPSLWSSLDTLVRKGWNDFMSPVAIPRVIDCGANIGVSVLNFRRLHPTCDIVAFEPSPRVLPYLRKNLAQNGVEGVKIVPAAAWIRDESELPFFVGSSDGGRLVPAPDSPGDIGRVAAVDLNRFLDETIDFLKMDVEGAEYQLIPHIASRLDRVAQLVVECHYRLDQAEDLARVISILGRAGFRVALNSMGKWHDLVRRPSSHEYEFDQYFLLAAWRE